MLKLTTADPAFDPAKPATINGFVFVPLQRVLMMIRAFPEFEGLTEREWEAKLLGDKAERERRANIELRQEHMLAPSPPSLRELERMRPGSRYVAPPRPAFAAGYEAPACRVRQEGDEFVCAACARRWGRDEERPDCANNPVRKD